MESIHEWLMCLETLIRQVKKGEECFIIKQLKKVMESVTRVKSLYYSFEIEFIEWLETTKEMVVIIKWVITNTTSGLSISKPKVSEPKSFDRGKEFQIAWEFLVGHG